MARLGYPYLALTVMLIALVATSVVAHVPLFGGGGGGLNEAREVDDPTKSWVIYTTYDGPGHVDYYRMSLKEGDLISLGLIVPASEGDRGFAPDIVLMGPGLEHDDAFPSQVQRADGGYIVIGSEEPSHLVYEPFSPSTFYEMAGIEITAPADGDYYVAVYDDSDGGEYGLVVGKRESFTLSEWLTTPFSLLTVYRWEGQQWWAILLPGTVAFLIGFSASSLGLRGSERRMDARWLLLALSGSLMIASAATFGFQTASKLLQLGELEPAAALSVAFTLVPLLLGIVTLRMAHRATGVAFSPRSRLALLAIAALGLLSWSGWVIGPVLAAVAAFLPDQREGRR